MTASLTMHPVRLLLVSALLMVGCAADDSLGGGTTATAVAPAPSADGAAPEPAPADDVTVTTTEALAGDAAGSNGATPESAAPTTDTAAPTTAAPTGPADGAEVTDTAAPASEAPAEPTPTTTAAPTSADGTEPTTTAAPTTAAPTTAAPEPSIDGFAVFLDATCDSCHRGDGDGTGADLQASTLERDAVIEVIRFGVAGTDMDGWDFEPKPPGLTREEIEAVADYVLTLRGG